MNSNFIPSEFFDNGRSKEEMEKDIYPFINIIPDKNHEEKIFIILYYIEDDDIGTNFNTIFSICIGRTNAYIDIKEKLRSGLGINIFKSKIITETKQTETLSGSPKYYLIPLEDCINIYEFCSKIKALDPNDDFDIEYYNFEDDPEETTKKEKNFLTEEQLEYQAMLSDSLSRKKFYMNNGINNNTNNI